MDIGAKYYALHVAEKFLRFQKSLTETGFDEVIISSGENKHQFQDDLFYPFKANPYFREWTPLNKRSGSYLHIRAGATKPTLYLLESEDIWHTERQRLPEGYADALTVIAYDSLDELKSDLNIVSGKPVLTRALISEVNSFEFPQECWNPQLLLNSIDFQRCSKTIYEQHCVREANRLAAPAHIEASHAFLAGCSELEICAAYYRASNTCESDMPYGVIAGVNEHAGVLHHFNLDKQRPRTPRSFLLDAGIDYQGYASDITRTYAYDPHCEFADMIRLLDQKQLELVAAGEIGKSFVELHELMLRKVAELLHEFSLLTGSIDESLETNLVDFFLPHGLGHHLGSSVHDRGSQFANAQGERIAAPEKYPTLRTAPMRANQIYTVEPGLYFIPSRLKDLREGKYSSSVVWSRVESFMPYGGIRIEDNIILHATGQLENMTRDAFKASIP